MALARRFVGEIDVGGYRTWVAVGGHLDFHGGRNGRHAHSFHEVCVALDGEGTFEHGDRTFGLAPGDLFLAHPGVVHEIVSSKRARSSLQIWFVAFDFQSRGRGGDDAGDLVERFQRQAQRQRRAIVHGCGSIADLAVALARIPADDEASWRIVSSRVLAAVILEIVARATERSRPSIGSGADDPALGSDGRLELALRFMDDNLERALSVPELARQARTSERTLRRLVRRATGRTIAAEFARRRMHLAARRLLDRQSDSVAQIGYSVGFSDPSAFVRTFRSAVGATPARFRAARGTIRVG